MNIIKTSLSTKIVKELTKCLLLVKHFTLQIMTGVAKAANKSNKLTLDNLIPSSNTEHALLLGIFGIVMLLIRIIPAYNVVFTNWPGEHGNYVNFAADDAVYHMRLVHNTLHHYPWRIFFDPFSYFPYGMQVIFGPLFTLIVATAALIIGLGHPSPELVNHVGAYIPPIMGALCLIPVYFIVRRIFGKTSAIISAFVLAFLPGEFLHRSMLGFIDHHVAEVLFSTTACAFLIYALAFSRMTTKNKPIVLIYGLLCGVTFGLFLLIWMGAMVFGVIFLAFLITQLLVDHINNNDTKYLLFLTGLIYFLPMIIILPYLLVAPLTIFPSCNILALSVSWAIFIVCYVLHLIFKYKKLTKGQVITLIGIVVFALIISKIASYFNVFKDFPCMTANYGALTISEMRSAIIGPDGKFTGRIFWNTYFWIMPLTIIGLGCLGGRVYKKKRPEEIFLLIWTLVIIAMTCKQTRFNYYLAINAAILSGYAIYFLFNLIIWLDFSRPVTTIRQKIGYLILGLLVALFVIRPIYLQLKHHKISSGGHITREWYDLLLWLRTHTPDPQSSMMRKDLAYNGYYAVPKNLSIPYNYPVSAYGVMTWWDEGHQITYIAHRIPNANPHQQGVIGQDGETGSAYFFTSTDENKAVNNLNRAGSRYIIINKYMATTKFGAIAIWSGNVNSWGDSRNIKIKFAKFPGKIFNIRAPIDSQKFLRSMVSRLFYDDASGLQHFRLIYESEGDYYVQSRMFKFLSNNPVAIRFGVSELRLKQYNHAFNAIKLRNRVISIHKDHNTFVYSVRPPVKYAKIFEKVKGAVIRGAVASNIVDGTLVQLTLKLKTKYGRIFIYEQAARVNNGKYSFIVPYPTTKMCGVDYNYDIQPLGKYQIRINKQVIEADVTEAAVMLGKDVIL